MTVTLSVMQALAGIGEAPRRLTLKGDNFSIASLLLYLGMYM